jgi:nicotinic acid phosphoribosyltransferase
MEKREKAGDTKAVLFKRLYGVKPDTFEKMKAILQKAFNELHKQGGKPPKLTVEDKLRITLKYLREYRTMESIGADYGVGKSAVCESIQWVEDTLT